MATEKIDIRRELFDWAQALVGAIILVILFFTFLARIISVDGESMRNTLQDKDRIVISSLFYQPSHGDIIVFTKPDYRVGSRVEPLVKRIIAVGGDVIDIDPEARTVSVNGEILDEPYIRNDVNHGGKWTYPMIIPEGSVFVMGDNRQNSRDSRDPMIGLVDERSIMGRLLFRLWPRPGAV